MSKSVRYPTKNEFSFLNHIRSMERKPVIRIMILLMVIFIIGNGAVAFNFSRVIGDLSTLITVIVINLFAIGMFVLLIRYPGYRIVNRPVQKKSGNFHFETVNTGRSTHTVYFIDDSRVIIPAHWVSNFKDGDKLNVEFYPLGNGRHIILSVGKDFSIDREIAEGKLSLD